MRPFVKYLFLLSILSVSVLLPVRSTIGAAAQELSYLDDRSSPESLLASLVNALNRREYLRAYSYWEVGTAQLAPFNQFAAGYADTVSVQITLGPVLSDAGAGQLRFNVPTVLYSTLSNGTVQTFAGCYTLHLSQPAIQGAPPFQPMAIESAVVRQFANGNAVPLQTLCPQGGYPPPPLPPTTTPEPNPASSLFYIDNRSTATDTLRSLFNAINRHEYVRAYSYWKPGAAQLGPYDRFAAGYADTAQVQPYFGVPLEDFGAGQQRYNVPVTLVTQNGQGQQIFVGCYVLHLASPSAQATPPFQPMAIESATIRLSTGAPSQDLESLSVGACAVASG